MIYKILCDNKLIYDGFNYFSNDKQAMNFVEKIFMEEVGLKNESLNEDFADTSRVSDIVRYCYSKDILDVDRIENIVRKQMTKEGSNIPDNLEECILETLDELFEDDSYDDFFGEKFEVTEENENCIIMNPINKHGRIIGGDYRIPFINLSFFNL